MNTEAKRQENNMKDEKSMVAVRVDGETKQKLEEVRRALGERSLASVLLLSAERTIKEVLEGNKKNTFVAS